MRKVMEGITPVECGDEYCDKCNRLREYNLGHYCDLWGYTLDGDMDGSIWRLPGCKASERRLKSEQR